MVPAPPLRGSAKGLFTGITADKQDKGLDLMSYVFGLHPEHPVHLCINKVFHT